MLSQTNTRTPAIICNAIVLLFAVRSPRLAQVPPMPFRVRSIVPAKTQTVFADGELLLAESLVVLGDCDPALFKNALQRDDQFNVRHRLEGIGAKDERQGGNLFTGDQSRIFVGREELEPAEVAICVEPPSNLIFLTLLLYNGMGKTCSVITPLFPVFCALL